MITVLVTEKEYHKAEDVFAAAEGLRCLPAPKEEKALAAMVEREKAKYVILGVDAYTGALYEALPSGGAIVRFGVGHDGVDKRQAAARGIHCANTPGVLDDSVAEFAVGLLLAAARRAGEGMAAVKGGGWGVFVGGELRGKTLAVVGCGNIGRKVAAIAKHGFGMKTVGCDTVPPKDASLFDVLAPDWSAAVADADYVTLHIPDLPATRDFVNARRLAAMKPGAWIVNTARGGILDEDALYDAVAGGRLGGAALDVFKREPYAPSGTKDLRTLDAVLMTPHLGSSTAEACRRMAEASLRNVRLCAEGRVAEMNLLPAPN